MPTIKDTITTLATDAGYDGDRPQTIADAIEAYGTVAGGGGGSTGMVVTATTQTSQTTKTIDKTFTEVMEYIAAGNYDVILVDKAAGGNVAYFEVAYGNVSGGAIQFQAFGTNGTEIFATKYAINSANPGVVTYKTVSVAASS